MTSFAGGPAAGVSLLLRRAPLYLRAVTGPDGKWDALDLLDDAPAPNETVVAYRRVGTASAMMLDWTEKGKRRGGAGGS